MGNELGKVGWEELGGGMEEEGWRLGVEEGERVLGMGMLRAEEVGVEKGGGELMMGMFRVEGVGVE